MSDLYWLTDEQMARLQPFFPKSHGKPRVDDRRVLSGIIFVNRNGLRLSIGVQKGPPIGVQKGPPSSSSVTGMTGAPFALVAA